MKITWDGKTHGKIRRGYIEDKIVAEIYTNGTHKQKTPNSDVYSLKVNGITIPTTYRYVTAAKKAAEQILNSKL